jgi:hypothetical protein
MKLADVKAQGLRAVHDAGCYRVDFRPETAEAWHFQARKLMDPDEGPEWVPIQEHKTKNWPLEGWNSIEDW